MISEYWPNNGSNTSTPPRKRTQNPQSMKHFTLIGIAALLGVSAQGQVFTSGVEDWENDLPTDFVGSKTNIALSAITQESADVHGGSYAVRLENATSSHKRFTTQTVEVMDGETYDITFWVRGEGQIRVGLFDGRPGSSSGYSPYNPQNYVDITGNTWQQVTLSVIAANDTTGAEFIFSVRNTVAPEHLVIDDVNIEVGAAQGPTSIYDIQFSTAGDGASPLAGQNVTTGGIVTAVFPSGSANPGYFIQDGSGPWNGIFVYDQDNTPAIGDSLTIAGMVSEYFSLTEISGVAVFNVESSGNTLPAASIVTTAGGAAEMYESVLVKVVDATCTNPSAANGQWIINDGSADLFVSPLMYDYTATQGTNYDVTGPMYYSFSEWKILPRDINDISVSTSIGEFANATITLFPNPASDALILDLGTLAGRTEYIMTDATGRIVLANVANQVRNTIDVSSLSNGLYVVTLRNAGSAYSTRVQVQH